MPDVTTELTDAISTHYAFRVTDVTRLRVDDYYSSIYRISTHNCAYFAKLRDRDDSGLLGARVAWRLHELGVPCVIPPLVTQTGDMWVGTNVGKLALYPYVEGVDGFSVSLEPAQWETLGRAMAEIHRAEPGAELAAMVPREDFSPWARERMLRYLDALPKRPAGDDVYDELVTFLVNQRSEILRVIRATEHYLHRLREQDVSPVLCHGDLHGGNILIGPDAELYVVDWDVAVVAPVERDLMFIGGGVGGVWNRAEEEDLFYAGYGEVEINRPALAYYRYERIVQDLAEFCDQILAVQGQPQDRRQALACMVSNFHAGNTVDMADRAASAADRCRM